ncbi:hypothetical protein AOLI_G00232880 [Acnodon oligacanthus]
MTDRRLDQSESPSEPKGRGFIRLQFSTDRVDLHTLEHQLHQTGLCVLQGKENKMSSVKEECENISVMEVTGLKTEDQQMDKERILYKIKEEHKSEVRQFQEEYISQKPEQGKESKMSSVKEECEDICVMEATGLMTEDQQMDKDIKEEHKPEVKLFQEEYDAKKPPQSTEPGNSFCTASHPKGHLRIHTREDPSHPSSPASPVWEREGRERKMSNVKEEYEDISVMEATGLKTEDQQMDKDIMLCEDIKEDNKSDVMTIQEEPGTQPLHQDAQHGSSFSDAFLLKDHLRIHTGDGPKDTAPPRGFRQKYILDSALNTPAQQVAAVLQTTGSSSSIRRRRRGATEALIGQ